MDKAEKSVLLKRPYYPFSVFFDDFTFLYDLYDIGNNFINIFLIINNRLLFRRSLMAVTRRDGGNKHQSNEDVGHDNDRDGDGWKPEEDDSIVAQSGEIDRTASLREQFKEIGLTGPEQETENNNTSTKSESEEVIAPKTSKQTKTNFFDHKGKQRMKNNAFKASISINKEEDVKTLLENIQAAVDEYGPAAELECSVDFLSANPLACSTVIITGKSINGKYRSFLLFLEKGIGTFKPFKYTENHDSYEVPPTLNHAYDDHMKKAVQDKLKARGIEKTTIIDYLIVDNRIDLKSIDNAGILTVTALLRIGSDATGLGAISLKELVKEGYELRNSISIAPGMTDTDILGKEVASDFTSIISAYEKGDTDSRDKQHSINADDGVKQIIKTNAILDAIIVDPELTGEDRSLNRTEAILKPMIVATNIEGISQNQSELNEDTKTILTSLFSMTPFLEKDNWMQIVDRHVSGSGKASIGVVGMYHNSDPAQAVVPGEIKVAETDSRANEKLASPLQVARDYFVEGMPILGFDVVNGSRSASAARLLVEATKPGDVGKLAKAQVLQHIDDMGDGTFSANWKDKDFIVPLSILVDGVIENSDGSTASTSSFDNFQAMKACNGNVEALMSILIGQDGEYNFSPKFLAKRIEMMNSLGALTVKAYGTRYYFTPEFTAAMDKYLHDSGVIIRYDGISTINNTRLSGGINVSGFSKSFKSEASSRYGYRDNQSIAGSSFRFNS